jgi:hypothetical protein
MKGTMKFLLIVLGVIACIFLPSLVKAADTDEKTTSSNVTVNTYVSISLSTAFANGVEFGSLDPNTNNNNATTCNGLGCNITVSADTNTVVDIVMNGTVMTRFGGAQTIPASAYTWNTTNGTSLPNPIIPLNATVYEYRNGYKVGDSVSASGVRSWQAQLDIPSAQTAGLYNNTLAFCANQEDTFDCG